MKCCCLSSRPGDRAEGTPFSGAALAQAEMGVDVVLVSFPCSGLLPHNLGVSHADLSAARWQELSDESAVSVAGVIARENQLELVGVRDHEYAGTHQRIALFERAGLRLSLIPAGRVVLGYDGAGFIPSAGQAASYAESASEYGLPAIAELIDSMTSPQRVADLPAMLVAVEALDAGGTEVEAGDPRVQALAARAFPGSTASTSVPGGRLKVEFGETGQVHRARLVSQVSYADAITEAASRGVRPATPDEWEYACGAGARTLFRWGDDTPDDCYPHNRRAGPHREPNLWGLMIGQDPYRHERTTEPGIVCGGDGGGAICGGSGWFLGWLTLATAYRDKAFGAWLNSGHGYIDELHIRPVVDML
jgi:hypothetical protein